MTLDLQTTNLFLGIIAAVSLFEATAVFVTLLMAFLVYRRVMAVAAGIEARHVAPAAARVNAILDDVKGVTGRLNTEAGRFERMIEWLADWCRCRRTAA